MSDCRRCEAVNERGRRCLLVKHGPEVQHCTADNPKGGWFFWPPPSLAQQARERIAAMSDAQVADLWERLQRVGAEDERAGKSGQGG